MRVQDSVDFGTTSFNWPVPARSPRSAEEKSPYHNEFLIVGTASAVALIELPQLQPVLMLFNFNFILCINVLNVVNFQRQVTEKRVSPCSFCDGVSWPQHSAPSNQAYHSHLQWIHHMDIEHVQVGGE